MGKTLILLHSMETTVGKNHFLTQPLEKSRSPFVISKTKFTPEEIRITLVAKTKGNNMAEATDL